MLLDITMYNGVYLNFRKIMNQTIELGKINHLKVLRVSEPGLYLIANNEEEVLLPNAYITKQMNLDDIIEVFIYTDSEDRLVATTLKPYAYVNEFATLEVVDIAKFGAFLDIGLPKDLLIPKNRQKTLFNIGDTKVVQIICDEKTNRLIGSEKFVFEKACKTLTQNDEIEILVYAKTPLGFKVIVNNQYEGLIYHNEIFENVQIGQHKRAFVKYVRDDGKLDITLQKIGIKNSEDHIQKVLETLKSHGGQLPFTYKSNADDIKETFGISKKVFKSALTQLISKNDITLNENSIKVNHKS